ncbi:hypothetical protein [Hansschlegelia beijingensis]|uniref:DUF732 domain-containing protein n=1 Tax=Hansschlegelia beijingensis TaxID=1133344 RepID=A0A7W6CY99_9HYPH|nr:hypothetical protein [Hansschlegelia beijingensis]MBB3972504.1 hypothetical protein [Hansschlegelia beijingensis]
MNRRGFLLSASAATALPAVALADAGPDAFSLLIQAAIAGDDAYAADPMTGVGDSAYDEAVIARTYGPPFERLSEGDLPVPTSAVSAALGLRYCLKNLGSMDFADAAIVTAVLAFLENEGGQS